MGLFKSVGTGPHVFLPVLLVYLKNKLPSGQNMYIAASNMIGAPSWSFVSQWHKKHVPFYINTHILVPTMTFYDAKPQSVKTPVAA